ncbi:MAG: RecQ family ATP-dependent DNA helicase [Pleurocapsa sp.]
MNWQEVENRFRDIWGYESFRPPQGEIIRTLLAGQDALVVMPTGGGKSICFQLPAILQTGLTLVISPLVALMENQVSQLQQLSLPGALIHSELSRQAKKQTLQAIATQKLRLLYLSPETLLSRPVWEILIQPQIKITGLILDEVHCLTQWGTTFRPAYRRLGVVRPSLLKFKPPGTKIAIAAFTATADPTTQREITEVLNLQKPEKFLISPYRSNLNLQVQRVCTPKGRKNKTLQFIQKRKNQSGLIYVRSRRDSEMLAQWFQSLNYSVAAYHAGLVTQQRRIIERNWLEGKTQFVVCTSAFGMGIDKSDVGWIVHFHHPELLAEYIQEVGRSGRNGQTATALTLISEPTGLLNPEDKQRSKFFSNQLQKKYQQAQQLFKQLPERGNVTNITQEFPQAEISLGILHSLGLIAWQDPFYYQKKSLVAVKKYTKIEEQSGHKLMQQYLNTKQCRWQFLLLSFGFKTNFKCGHCDNCC